MTLVRHRLATSCRPRHPPLAELQVCPDTSRSNGDIVDIDNDIDWHEKHVLLKAAFPLAVTSDFATYEIPYGTIQRPTTRNNSLGKGTV